MPFFFTPCLKIRRKYKRKSKKRDEKIITFRDVTSPVTTDIIHSSQSNSNASIFSEISEIPQSVSRPEEILATSTRTNNVELSITESTNEEGRNTRPDVTSTVHSEVNALKDTSKDSLKSTDLDEDECTNRNSSENIYRDSDDSNSVQEVDDIHDVDVKEEHGCTTTEDVVEKEKNYFVATENEIDQFSDSEETKIYIQKSYDIISKITVNCDVFEKIEELKAIELAAKKAREKKKRKLEEEKLVSEKTGRSVMTDIGDTLDNAENEPIKFEEERKEIANINATLEVLTEDERNTMSECNSQIDLETALSEEYMNNDCAENIEAQDTNKPYTDLQDRVVLSNNFGKHKTLDQKHGDGVDNFSLFEKQKLDKASQTDFKDPESVKTMTCDDSFEKHISPSTDNVSILLDAPIHMECTKVASVSDKSSQTCIPNDMLFQCFPSSSSSSSNEDNFVCDLKDKFLNKKDHFSNDCIKLPEAAKDCLQANKMENIEVAHTHAEGNNLHSVSHSSNSVKTNFRHEEGTENDCYRPLATFQIEDSCNKFSDNVFSEDYHRSGDSINVRGDKGDLPLNSLHGTILKYKTENNKEEKSKKNEIERNPPEGESEESISIQNENEEICPRIYTKVNGKTDDIKFDIANSANIRKGADPKDTALIHSNEIHEKHWCAREPILNSDKIHENANLLLQCGENNLSLQDEARKFIDGRISTSESENYYSDDSKCSEESEDEEDTRDSKVFPFKNVENRQNVSRETLFMQPKHSKFIRYDEKFQQNLGFEMKDCNTDSEENSSSPNFGFFGRTEFDNRIADFSSKKTKIHEQQTHYANCEKKSNRARHLNRDALFYEKNEKGFPEKNVYKKLLEESLQKNDKHAFEKRRELKSVSKYSLSPASDSSSSSKMSEGGDAKDLSLNAKTSESFLISGWGDNKLPAETPQLDTRKQQKKFYKNPNRDLKQLLVISKDEMQKLPNRRKIKISITKKGMPKDNITITTDAADDRCFCLPDSSSNWQSGDHIEVPSPILTNIDEHELNDVLRKRGNLYSPPLDDVPTDLDTLLRFNAINEIEGRRRESIDIFNKKIFAAESDMGTDIRIIPITKSRSFALKCDNAEELYRDTEMKYLLGELGERERNSTNFLQFQEFKKNKIPDMKDKTPSHAESIICEGEKSTTHTESSPPTSEKMTPARKRILDASRCIRSAKYPFRMNKRVIQTGNLYPIDPVFIKSPKLNVVYLTKDDKNVYQLKKGYKLYSNSRKFKYLTSDIHQHVPGDSSNHHKQHTFPYRATSPVDMKIKFDDLFRKYAGKGRANGELISYKRSTEWLRDAGVIGKVLTAEEANDVFKCAAGVKVALNKGDYRNFLYKLSRVKRLNYNEIYERLCDAKKCVHG